jgi:hypothetical protein
VSPAAGRTIASAALFAAISPKSAAVAPTRAAPAIGERLVRLRSCSLIISSQRTPRSRGAEGVPCLRWFCPMFLRSDSSAARCDCFDDQPMSFPSLASSFSLVNHSIIMFRSSFLWQNARAQDRAALGREYPAARCWPLSFYFFCSDLRSNEPSNPHQVVVA